MTSLGQRARPVSPTLLAVLFFACMGLAVASAQANNVEQADFDAARGVVDPDLRVVALGEFLRRHPDGSRHEAASRLLLQTYLDHLPDRLELIHTLAQATIAAATPGLDRWTEEAHTADLLADAGPHGVDLADALRWARDAVNSMTEPAYKRDVAAMQARYKLPRLTSKQLQEQFTRDRAACLASLANVLLRQGAPEKAAPLLTDAFQLDPLSAEVNRLRAELALAQQHQVEALDLLLRANAIAPLPPADRAQELTLFRAAGRGDEAALDAAIDSAYTALYPRLFILPPRQLPAGGHPALLELFTGSDCAPCTGPDLALESLLGSYSRQDLIALAFDEHIPTPDPLATPGSVARAAFYRVDSTPQAFLDGQPAELLGSSRQDVENIVIGLAAELEDEAHLPSGLRLDVVVPPVTGNGEIHPNLHLALSPLPPGTQPGDSTGDTSLRALQRAVLYVALVQDQLRYPGKNGVRFHRMVVRALQESPAAGWLTSPAGARTVSFDPQAIGRDLESYLHHYETSNDRFGAFQFRVNNIALDPHHLAVVAWVQDPVSRRVLQATFAPVP